MGASPGLTQTNHKIKNVFFQSHKPGLMTSRRSPVLVEASDFCQHKNLRRYSEVRNLIISAWLPSPVSE